MSDYLAPDAPIIHLLSLRHTPLDKMSDEELLAYVTKLRTITAQPTTLKAVLSEESKSTVPSKKKAFLNDLLS